MDIKKEVFGKYREKQVDAYTLKNDHGMEVTFITYGGAVTKILVPDRNGRLENVVLGFGTLDAYIEHTHYFGAIVGRVAGRIGQSRYDHQGETVELTPNEGENHLHGGRSGFNSGVWEEEEVAIEFDRVSVKISYLSRDGEEGYPGNLKVFVTYTLTNEGCFHIKYQAEADRDTPLNLTNHSYFNLSGDAKEDVLGHVLQMDADSFLPLSEENLPTGEIRPVEGTAFDFRQKRTIREDMGKSEETKNGYDHPFVLNKSGNITLSHEGSGRVMTVGTDQESFVLYTGNFLTGDILSEGVPAGKHAGLCLETQGYPDAVNHPHFPSVMVKAGEEYRASTSYTFTVKK
ncbi:aldose epimerase family protein [Rossellomorea sp. NS-SX7]|uniref:aldose epimerase family protein n=1 Tax=Rossellomorea sp. NS-SX7 TaxID=3463856 RepID=UPI00405873B4